LEIEAVVFDLGGTLIEYAGAYVRWPELETPGFTAAHDYLIRQGITLPEFARFQAAAFELLPGRWRRATAGEKNLRLVELLQEVVEACDGVCPEATWLNEAAERYQAAVRAQAEPIAGAQAVVAHLKEQGYRLGLLSNTMFTGVAHREDLARFGLADYFDTMVFSADVGKWKPNAEPFLHVLEDLKVSPEAAVYIGDDPASDVVGGRRAGMRTIHFRSSDRFASPDGVKPHAAIDSLAELPPLLTRWKMNG